MSSRRPEPGEAAIDAAREAVAGAIGSIAGKVEPLALLHAVAHLLGALGAVRSALTGGDLERQLQQLADTMVRGAEAEQARRALSKMRPVGRA